MSDIMYDGLVTTHPVTGETIPKLAKSFSVNGNEYIIKLRKGIKWSDGKPITADDVVLHGRILYLTVSATPLCVILLLLTVNFRLFKN